MVIDDPLGAIHTAVANFNGVTIGDVMKLVIFGKVVYLLSEESVSDVSADVLAEGVGCTRGYCWAVGFFFCQVLWVHIAG